MGNFISIDLIKYDCVSEMHLLIDGYLGPDYGNNPIKSFNFFIKSLEKNNNYGDIVNILKKSLEYNDEIRGKFTGEFINSSKETSGTKIRKEWFNDNSNIEEKITSNYVDLICELEKHININIDSKYDDIIIPCGYKTIYDGHLICLYYFKYNGKRYIILSNSGDGLEYHPSYDNDNKKMQQILICRKVTNEKFLTWMLIFSIIKWSEKTQKIVNNFYQLFNLLFPESITDNTDDQYEKELINKIEQVKMGYPQMSGSCTFYGLYYGLRGLMKIKNYDYFEEYDKMLRVESRYTIMEKIKNKQVITEYDLTLLSILKNQVEITEDYSDVYKKYLNEVKKSGTYPLGPINGSPKITNDKDIITDTILKENDLKSVLIFLYELLKNNNNYTTYVSIVHLLNMYIDECINEKTYELLKDSQYFYEVIKYLILIKNNKYELHIELYVIILKLLKKINNVDNNVYINLEKITNITNEKRKMALNSLLTKMVLMIDYDEKLLDLIYYFNEKILGEQEVLIHLSTIHDLQTIIYKNNNDNIYEKYCFLIFNGHSELDNFELVIEDKIIKIKHEKILKIEDDRNINDVTNILKILECIDSGNTGTINVFFNKKTSDSISYFECIYTNNLMYYPTFSNNTYFSDDEYVPNKTENMNSYSMDINEVESIKMFLSNQAFIDKICNLTNLTYEATIHILWMIVKYCCIFDIKYENIIKKVINKISNNDNKKLILYYEKLINGNYWEAIEIIEEYHKCCNRIIKSLVSLTMYLFVKNECNNGNIKNIGNILLKKDLLTIQKFYKESIVEYSNGEILFKNKELKQILLLKNTEYNEFFKHFIFEKVKDGQYVSVTTNKHIKYKLYLEQNDNSTNYIYMPVKINGKDIMYTLVESSEISNIFKEIKKNIIVYKDSNKNYIIDVYEILDYKSDNYMRFMYENEVIYYWDYVLNKKRKLHYSENVMLNKWIYGIPGAFIICDEEDKYKRNILFPNIIDKDFVSYCLKSSPHKKDNIYLLDLPDTLKKKYCIGTLSDSFLDIIFKNSHDMDVYIMLCLLLGKEYCLYDIINKLDDVNSGSYKLLVLQLCNIFNWSYYRNILTINTNEYDQRLFHNIFIKKYNTRLIKENYDKYLNEKVEYDLFGAEHVKSVYDFISEKFKKYEPDNTKKLEKYKGITGNNKLFDSDKITVYEQIEAYFDNKLLCNLNMDNNKCDLENNKFSKTIINDIYYELYNDYISNDVNTLTHIFENHKIFYELMELRLIRKVCINMEKQGIDLDKKNACIELSKIYSIIDKSVLYIGKRTFEIILFEIIFGYFIRNEQYYKYSSICNTIDHNKINSDNPKSYDIHQLLMGKGKTSVILPLVTCKYLFRSDIQNTVIILPDHLVQQTYDDIRKTCCLLYKDFIITKIVNLELSDKLDTFDDKVNYRKNIYVTNSKSIKIFNINLAKNKSDTSPILYKSIIIFDEFDYQYNPLNSDLNCPDNENVFMLDYINQDIIYIYYDFVNYIIKNNVIVEDIHKTFSEYAKDAKSTFITEYIKWYNSDSDAPYNNISYFYELLNVYMETKSFIFNKNYGFPQNNSHTETILAVPYSAVKTPIAGSKFSDMNTTFILTLLAYIHNEFRMCDIIELLKNLHNMLISDDIQDFFVNCLKNISLSVEIIRMIEIFDENNEYIKWVYNELNKPENVEKVNIVKREYFTNIVYKQIYYSKKYINCTTMDIMDRKFCRYKTGFTGTANIILPIYSSNDYNFCNITSQEEDNGSIYLALLGEFSTREPYNCDRNKQDILEQLVKCINDDYNVFVDSGAFLRNNTCTQVINYVYENCKIKRKYYVYINDTDTKMVFNTINKKHERYNGEIYDTKDLFIYYDNRHIIGIDIKQPFNLKGLVSVAPDNKLTDVAQAIYRLRNIGYGHCVDFICDSTLELDTNQKVYNRLITEEKQYVTESTKHKFIEQNISLLKKSYNGIESWIYTTCNIYKILKENSNKNIKSLNIQYEKYSEMKINDEKYEQIDNYPLIKNLYNTLLEFINNYNNNSNNLETIKSTEISKVKILEYEKVVNLYGPIIEIHKYDVTIKDILTMPNESYKNTNVYGNIYVPSTFNPKIFPSLIRGDTETYKEYLCIHNFYYMIHTKDNTRQYLLIDNNMYNYVMKKIQNEKYDHDIIIKHKNGTIKYGEEKENYEADLEEILVMYILGKKITNTIYRKLYKMITTIDLLSNIINFVNKYQNFYGVRVLDNLEKKIMSCKNTPSLENLDTNVVIPLQTKKESDDVTISNSNLYLETFANIKYKYSIYYDQTLLFISMENRLSEEGVINIIRNLVNNETLKIHDVNVTSLDIDKFKYEITNITFIMNNEYIKINNNTQNNFVYYTKNETTIEKEAINDKLLYEYFNDNILMIKYEYNIYYENTLLFKFVNGEKLKVIDVINIIKQYPKNKTKNFTINNIDIMHNEHSGKLDYKITDIIFSIDDMDVKINENVINNLMYNTNMDNDKKVTRVEYLLGDYFNGNILSIKIIYAHTITYNDKFVLCFEKENLKIEDIQNIIKENYKKNNSDLFTLEDVSIKYINSEDFNKNYEIIDASVIIKNKRININNEEYLDTFNNKVNISSILFDYFNGITKNSVKCQICFDNTVIHQFYVEYSIDNPLTLDICVEKSKKILRARRNGIVLLFENITHNYNSNNFGNPSLDTTYKFNITGYLIVVFGINEIPLMADNEYVNFGIQYKNKRKYNPYFFNVDKNDVNYQTKDFLLNFFCYNIEINITLPPLNTNITKCEVYINDHVIDIFPPTYYAHNSKYLSAYYYYYFNIVKRIGPIKLIFNPSTSENYKYILKSVIINDTVYDNDSKSLPKYVVANTTEYNAFTNFCHDLFNDIIKKITN